MKLINLLHILPMVSAFFWPLASRSGPPATIHFGAPHLFTAGIEGPAQGPDGFLYIVNFQKEGTIGRLNVEGKAELFVELPQGSIGNAIRFDSEGDLLVADYSGHNLLRIGRTTRAVAVVAHDARFNQPNDLALAKDGTVYLSDPSWKDLTGNLWSVSPKGEIKLLEANMGTTNGIELDPSGRFLYVNESAQRRLWRYEIASNGALKDKKLLFELKDQFKGGDLDGMKFGPDGTLYATLNGAGLLLRFSAEGALLETIPTLGRKPSNIAFGGRGGKTAYITEVDCGCVEAFTRPIEAGKAPS